MAKIVVIESDLLIVSLLEKYLLRHHHSIAVAHTGKAGLELVETLRPDILLCDFMPCDITAAELMLVLKTVSRNTKAIFMAAAYKFRDAVNILRLGATDFITKPLIPHEILQAISEALLATSNCDADNKSISTSANQMQYWFSDSHQSIHLKKQIELVAPTAYTVIIHGESGSGKEGVARTIHSLSKRHKSGFSALDCGTLLPQLAASELFGHVKGAFSGAIANKKGQFESCAGGTLFLDEVGNLPHEVQRLLLRALQEKKIRPVGGLKEIAIDVRIVVASNERLTHAVEQGRFRMDLFHRLSEFSIDIPPLRERKDDILFFAERFLSEVSKELGRPVPVLTDMVKERLQNYYWAGNLRELKNCLRRMMLLTTDDTIASNVLPKELRVEYAGAVCNVTQTEPAMVRSCKVRNSNLRLAAIEEEYEKLFSRKNK